MPNCLWLNTHRRQDKFLKFYYKYANGSTHIHNKMYGSREAICATNSYQYGTVDVGDGSNFSAVAITPIYSSRKGHIREMPRMSKNFVRGHWPSMNCNSSLVSMKDVLLIKNKKDFVRTPVNKEKKQWNSGRSSGRPIDCWVDRVQLRIPVLCIRVLCVCFCILVLCKRMLMIA